MAIALLRLVTRGGLDDDPLISALKTEAEDKRKAKSSAGRNAARRTDPEGDDAPHSSRAAVSHTSHSSSEAVTHKTPRSSSKAVAHKNA